MGPLEGIKVLDLTSMVSGPASTMMLADQGAEVIKIEPYHGEQVRHMAAPHNGVNPVFYSCNRGKKSVALDLKTDAGKEVLMKLADQADVFIQNFRPGAIDRMGFGEEVCARNESLIYVSISGFGEKGPYAQSRVYDPVIQALSGATDIQADRASGRPQMFRIIIADKVTALTQRKPCRLPCLPANAQARVNMCVCPCLIPCWLFSGRKAWRALSMVKKSLMSGSYREQWT